MRYGILFLSLVFLNTQKSEAQTKVNLSPGFGPTVESQLKPFYSPSKGQIEDLLKGEVISVGKVESKPPKDQEMFLIVAGIHPRNCTRAMRKLSLYENFHEYMDFVKSSSYLEQEQRISLVIDHTLLPFPMVVKFRLPRIKGEGVYPFVFEDGFLKNLMGKVIVKETAKFCLLGLKTDWRGPESPIPNIVFATFVQTVGKLGLEHLIRVSLF